MDNPVDFVRRLEIAEPMARPVVGNQGFVDAGSLVTFTSDISEQHRSDVLYSTLLAQLAADKQFDRLTKWDQWYNFYVNVLSSVGWVIQGFDFHKYSTKEEHTKISDVVISTVRPIVSESDVKVVEDSLNALSSDQKWWPVFTGKGYASGKGNFQIVPSKQSSSGDVVMSTACFRFSAPPEDRWLWFNYQSKDVDLYVGTQSSILDESLYSQVRQEVITKLGGYIKTFIGELTI